LPDATGTMTGLRSDTAPAQLARAAYEGVVLHVLEALDALTRAGVPTDRGRLFVVGGGARSRLYPQLLADLAQRPVEVPEAAEYVARGACVQAAAALHGHDVAEIARVWAPECSLVEPNLDVDAAALRDAYAARRIRAHPESGVAP